MALGRINSVVVRKIVTFLTVVAIEISHIFDCIGYGINKFRDCMVNGYFLNCTGHRKQSYFSCIDYGMNKFRDCMIVFFLFVFFFIRICI